MEKCQVSILKENDHFAYQKFLQENKSALYEHSLEVKDLVTRYFKFKPVYLVAKEREKIVGALPLFEAKSFVEGKRLVSIPFFPYGGVIGKENRHKKMLLEEAKKMALGSGYKFLQIRQCDELEEELAEGFVRQAPITDFFLRLKASPEEMFNSLDKRVRYDIRKAQKNNLQVKLGKNKALLSNFYKVYLHTKKRRGVPAWPYSLFAEALEKCNTLVGVTYLGKKPIAVAFFFLHRKKIEYGFAGANYKYARLSPYYALLWEAIKYGIGHGYEIFDFGGTTREINEGNLYAFKKHWCNEKKEIPYYFYAEEEKNIPLLRKSFKLYRLYGKIWGLLPRIVIKKISPPIIRQFI